MHSRSFHTGIPLSYHSQSLSISLIKLSILFANCFSSIMLFLTLTEIDSICVEFELFCSTFFLQYLTWCLTIKMPLGRNSKYNSIKHYISRSWIYFCSIPEINNCLLNDETNLNPLPLLQEILEMCPHQWLKIHEETKAQRPLNRENIVFNKQWFNNWTSVFIEKIVHLDIYGTIFTKIISRKDDRRKSRMQSCITSEPGRQ